MSQWLRDDEKIDEILSCTDEYGRVKAELVFDKARNKKSPLHEDFIWDKDAAFLAANLRIARALIRRVPVTYLNNDGQEKTVPRLISIAHYNDETDEKSRGYYELETVTSDKKLKALAIASALKEIERWQDIYHSYAELDQVVDTKEVARLAKEYA